MLTNSTDLPEAGWYADPANPSNERWWGGLEWTDTTRELRVKSAPQPHPAQPVFTGSFPPPTTPVTSTGGYQPPAATAPPTFPAAPPAPAAAYPAVPPAPPAPPAQPTAVAPYQAPTAPPQFAIAGPAVPTGALAITAAAAATGGFAVSTPPPVMLQPKGGLGGWVPAEPAPGVSELKMASGYGAALTASHDTAVSPSWYSNNNALLGTTPKNGQATAGLVLSILGLAPLGFIFSIVALAKASRIHRDGFPAIGRARAAWGLTLSILVLIAAPIGVSIGLPILRAQQELALEQLAAANAGADEDLTAGVVPIPLGAYDRTTFEQGLAEGFTQSTATAPESVTCPDTAGTAAGETITCDIIWQDAPHTMVMTFTDDEGNFTMTIDGVVQEEAARPVQ